MLDKANSSSTSLHPRNGMHRNLIKRVRDTEKRIQELLKSRIIKTYPTMQRLYRLPNLTLNSLKKSSRSGRWRRCQLNSKFDWEALIFRSPRKGKYQGFISYRDLMEIHQAFGILQSHCPTRELSWFSVWVKKVSSTDVWVQNK